MLGVSVWLNATKVPIGLLFPLACCSTPGARAARQSVHRGKRLALYLFHYYLHYYQGQRTRSIFLSLRAAPRRLAFWWSLQRCTTNT